MTTPRGRKKGSGKTRISIDKYLLSSEHPEEILFKLNELLYGEKAGNLRKNPRISVNLSVLWNSGDKIRQESTYTLSREGMFIKTLTPADINSEIELSFMIPGYSRLIRAKARVLHRIEPAEAQKQGLVSGMAVAFTEIDQDSQKMLDDFIQHRLKKNSKPKAWI